MAEDGPRVVARWVWEPGKCGAILRTETLFERYVQVCNRPSHDDNIHNDGTMTWYARAGEQHAMDYTCNAILKVASSTFFCELTLSHPGDHRDGVKTWPQQDLDDGLPPLW